MTKNKHLHFQTLELKFILTDTLVHFANTSKNLNIKPLHTGTQLAQEMSRDLVLSSITRCRMVARIL